MTILPTAVRPAASQLCQLAENPLWDERANCVYWTDIPAGKIFCMDYRTGQHRTVYQGEPVGGFTLQENGDLLLFRTNDIVLLDSSRRISKVIDFADEGMKRFNDVIADPSGRVFAGTIGDHPKGGLYRIEADGDVTKLFSGTGCSNGMGFSPDLSRFYWTCSTTRQIFQFNYDLETGAISNRTLFYATTAEEGIPDGLTVDSEGYVWSARWGGSAIIRHAPDGTPGVKVLFPVVNVTSLCFGGPQLNELFATAAQPDGNKKPVEGLLRTSVDFRGRLEYRSRLLPVSSQ